MKIRIEYTAILKIQGVKSGEFMELDEGTSISDLLDRFKVKKEHQRFILAFVNGEKRRLSYMLNDHDELKMLLPVGGG